MIRTIPISELTPGMRLAQSVYDAENGLVVCSGFTLRDSDLDRMKKLDIPEATVLDQDFPLHPEEMIRDTVRNAVKLEFGLHDSDLINQLPSVMQPDAIHTRIETSDIWRGTEATRAAIDSTFEIISRAVEELAPFYLSMPEGVFGDNEASHLLNVAILSLMLAEAFDCPPRDLRNLVLAALSHDLGRFLFPELRNKPIGTLEGDDVLIMREHPAYSAMLLRGTRPIVRDIELAVLHHHESFDGSGYPLGLKGVNSPPGVLRKSDDGNMHRFAEILNLANDYASHVDGSYDGVTRTALEASTIAVEQSGKLYNPFVVLELCSLIQRFPVGATVQILSTSSGRYVGFLGVIREAGDADQSNPVKHMLLIRNAKGVVLTPMEIDLSGERHVKLRLAGQ